MRYVAVVGVAAAEVAIVETPFRLREVSAKVSAAHIVGDCTRPEWTICRA